VVSRKGYDHVPVQDIADEAGGTALHYALKAGPDTDLVKYLRSVGARTPAGGSRQKPIPSQVVPAAGEPRVVMVRESAQRAIGLLQNASAAFLQNGFVRETKCVSCHHQYLPALAYSLGRERGVRVDDAGLGQQLSAQISLWSRKAENARQLDHPEFGLFQGLAALNALGYSPNAVTATIVTTTTAINW